MRFFVLLLILASCVSDPSKQSRNAYLLEEEDNTLSEVIEDITILLDLYPINGEIDKEKLSYELQRPRQFFSSGSNNEIRLHKLGQIRWLYVESLPSSVWPILNQYILKTKMIYLLGFLIQMKESLKQKFSTERIKRSSIDLKLNME